MTSKKKMLLAVTSAVLLSGGLLASSAFAAQDNTTASSLVSEIATKFNLKQTDVQAVFDQHKQEMNATRQQKLTDRLNAAVTSGKITTAQKDLIVAKLNEVEQKMADIRNMTDDTARKNARDQLHTDLIAWAKANNIDAKWIAFAGGRDGHRIRGGTPQVDGPAGE
jgi:hypothetical protein